MSISKKVSVITLGCSKNIVDSERLIKQLQSNDFKVIQDSYNADAIIINTCGFIQDAKEESINTILEAVETKKRGKAKKVIVFGCLSERYLNQLKKEIPEVDSFHGVEDYKGIIRNIEGKYRKELLGERHLLTPKHFAYLKISEGCNNTCSFCAIPIIRGKHKSKSIEVLSEEAKNLAAKGVRELIIIAQDTTCYGLDIYGKRSLALLLEKLSEIKNIEWIKLLYAYPTKFPKDVIEVIANTSNICNYIDMPLQHISTNVLKSMRRGITSEKTRELVSLLKMGIPNLTFRTTFITGYPTETEKDFGELCNFVSNAKFDRLGVFTYSPEDDTRAFSLEDIIPQEIKEERKATLMEIQQEISFKKNRELIGKQTKVIIDRKEDDFYIARSEKDAPEVDCEILIPTKKNKCSVGNFFNVEIYDCNEYDLYANINNNKGKHEIL